MSTRWWAPLAILPLLGIVMLGAQILVLVVTAIIEHAISGRDPLSTGMTPLMMLGVNLAIAILAPVALLAMRWIAGVPWRGVLAAGRRFSWSRLGRMLVVLGAVILVCFAAMSVTGPMPHLSLGAGTLALGAVALLTTPLQAASEEVVYRGAVMSLIGSWLRRPALAVVIGVVVSSLLFGVSHGAADPWLAAYYIVFGLSGALMAVITRGLEAPIAFHVANNTILMLATAATSGDGGVEIDRSAGQGGPQMLLFMGMDLLLVLVVWLLERRRRTRSSDAGNATGAA